MAIKTILFDLGNVLVYFSHERMVTQIGDVCGMAPADVAKLLLASGLNAAFERGKASEDEVHAEFERRVGRPIDRDALILAASDIFWSNPEIRPVLDEVRAQGYRMVLLSNTCVSHIRFVQERFDVLEPFDDLTLSYEVGAAKPERAIYEAALEKARCRPEECFYADDLLANVDAGREMGFQASLFTSVDQLLADLREHGVDLSPAGLRR